jgi:hypothetical protein
MTILNLFDKAVVGNVRTTQDGYLVGEAKVARTGIQEYLASEIGLTDRNPNEIIRVFRGEGEVFATDSLASYAYRPVTVDHPGESVTAENWKDYSRGQIGAEVVRDGEYVRVPMILMDQTAIADWKDGKRELSMGYSAEIVMQDGVAPNGEKYDAIQKNLRMNHLALVSRARGGSQLKLGDNLNEDRNMALKTIIVDGLSVETTDAGELAIKTLQSKLADAQSAITNANTAHQQAIADKDKELAKKDAELDALKGKVLSDADLDAAVKVRADLISTAKTIADKDYTGKSEIDIKKLAVTAKLGDAAITGKSDDYVSARFDILAEDAAKDPVRKIQMSQTNPTNLGDADAAYATMLTDLGNAYKNGGAK